MSPTDYTLPDPRLTDEGEAQCAKLRENLISTFSKDVGNPDDIAIVVSPMRRTLQTVVLSMDWLVERGVKIEGNADWQVTNYRVFDFETESDTDGELKVVQQERTLSGGLGLSWKDPETDPGAF
ncbi:phosphoglycerate mutase [Fusarium langsethiae]|uniref:Phosphoglycerate mutase n=1 Tax=Fusarium langsethiae TaxID=179993 RepID=A0A0M9ENR9_FUSLA|nr:phosphoglycerate mutase [Fusarium langsethiae]